MPRDSRLGEEYRREFGRREYPAHPYLYRIRLTRRDENGEKRRKNREPYFHRTISLLFFTKLGSECFR
jgi:hypothetical protein